MAYSTSLLTSSTVRTSGTMTPMAPTSSSFKMAGRLRSRARTKGVQPRRSATRMASMAVSASKGPCSVSTMRKSMPPMPTHSAAMVPPIS